MRNPRPTPTTAGDAPATDATGSEPAAARRGGVLRYGEALGPSRFDPHRSTIGQDIRLLAPVYDRLVHFDADGALVPGLATEWSFDDTGTVFTMQLREGVVFHDGAPFARRRRQGEHRARPDGRGFGDRQRPVGDHGDRDARHPHRRLG